MKDGETRAEQGRGGYATKSASLMLFNIALPPLPQETPEQVPSGKQSRSQPECSGGTSKGGTGRQWADAAPVLPAVPG